MPKGYIDFDTFKKQTNTKLRPKKYKCPKCHQYVEDTITNLMGKKLCINCYLEEESRKKKVVVYDKESEETVSDKPE